MSPEYQRVVGYALVALTVLVVLMGVYGLEDANDTLNELEEYMRSKAVSLSDWKRKKEAAIVARIIETAGRRGR